VITDQPTLLCGRADMRVSAARRSGLIAEVLTPEMQLPIGLPERQSVAER
jgi:hypothetical protein